MNININDSVLTVNLSEDMGKEIVITPMLEHFASAETLDINLTGRLDTSSAPLYDKLMNKIFELEASKNTKKITLDFSGLEYLSSAGLRVLLMLHKKMDKRGGLLELKNITLNVLEVLNITGFSGLLNIVD